jgi:DNA-binding NtrC family response regulator
MTKFPRVLIVDDDRTIRQALALALDEAGYESHTACGIEDARNQLAEGDFKAVLLDIRLKDGRRPAPSRRSAARHPHLPSSWPLPMAIASIRSTP